MQILLKRKGCQIPARKPHLEVLESRYVLSATDFLAPSQLSPPSALQVVLVSDAVEQPQRVAAAALPGVTARVYSAAALTSNGLVALLEEIAADHDNAPIERLALVTHGAAGRLKLGSETVWGLDDGSETAAAARRLRTLLTPHAQLDLYACNLAQGPEGEAFVSTLAAWTGAAVRASTNAVGSGARADFLWEFAAGTPARPEQDLLDVDVLESIAGLVLHDDGYEPNNSKAAVDSSTRPEGSEGAPKLGTLTSSKTIPGLIMQDTEDWFQFRIASTGGAGHRVRIDITFGDLDLHVYRADGTTRVGASEAVGQNFEQVSLEGVPVGVYYVRVFPKGAIPDSNYQLRIDPPGAVSSVLAVTFDAAEVSEAAGNGAVLATVSRTGSTSQALDVTLTSSRPGDVRVAARLTIPAGAERASAALDLLDNNLTDGTRGVTLTAAAPGHRPGTATLNVLDNEGVNGLFFSQANVIGVEGTGSVRLTVVRGSLQADRSVVAVYNTSDGTARAGTDYTAASGTLSLAAGEVSKSITVGLVDDGAAKAARSFTVSLSIPSGGATLLSPSRVTVSIRDNDLPEVADGEPPARIGVAADGFAHSRELYSNFVVKAYQTYLKRGPDQAGLNGWVEAMLARQVTDELLESGFIGSPEYIEKNGGRGRGWVVGMYKDLLGRTPAEFEVQAWLQALSNGVTEQQVALGFAASAEREGQRVRENYRTYLDRVPGQAEVDAYVAEFVAGRLTNEDVIARFVGSPEYYGSPRRGQGNKAVWVAAVYEQVLFRFAARGEVEGWVRALS